MDTNEVLERHDKYMKPYRVYFFILEFLVLPVGAILTGYALGFTSQASVMAITYLIADILTTAIRGRTFLGTKIGWIKPLKLPYPRILTTVISGVFLVFLTAIAILEMINGHMLIGLGSLCLVAICISALIMQWKKQYDQRLSILSAFLLLVMVLLIAAYVENPIIRLITFLLALAWSFFVALGVYNVFIKRKQVQA